MAIIKQVAYVKQPENEFYTSFFSQSIDDNHY